MPETHITNIFLEQSSELVWIIDSNFFLKYANQAYQNAMKRVTGEEKKMEESIFTEGFSDGYIEKWKAYYERGLKGEQFEIEENFYNPFTNQIEYSQISFKPLTNENQVVVNVACQSRDITSFIKSNSEAEKLLEASLDVICSIDEHGIFTKVNAACKELWGYEKHELIGKAYISFVVEADIEKTNLVEAEIIAGKAFTNFENRYKRKDGGIAFNLWSARWDPKSKIMFCIARDAKEKIRKEELLIESGNRFKALVQEGSDLIGILDEAGIYTYVSPTSMGLLDMEPEELIGKSPFDYIHPQDAEKTQNSLSKIATESRVEVEPFRFKNKNGEWRWIEMVLTNMLDNPAIKGIVANSRDITAKKKETQHLKLLKSVITNTKDAVLITEAEPFDEPGPRILYVNEAFTRMTGYTAEEVIGKTPRILQGPNSNKAELAVLSKAIRNWEPCEITTINYKKNGDEFWINFSVSPVADETGWYTHWIAIERDVTENKKRELSTNLVSKISTAFNVELDLSSALSKLCEEVATVGQFSFCEIWLTDIQESILELKAAHKYDDAATVFYENSKLDTVVERGQGTNGKIWENIQPIIWEHKGKNQELLYRSVAAEKAGIKTIVGFPLMHHNKFIGVLQFGTKTITKNLEWIVTVLEELGAFIGAEIARKKTEIELTKIFEFAPDIIAITGFDGYLKKVNPNICKILGYAENELILKPFSEHIHPDDLEKSMEELHKLSSGKPLYNWVNRHIAKNGDIITISWNVSPSLEDGLIFCIGKDVTEEVKIGKLLKESNQLSRIGSWEIDLINNSIFWSDITHEIHETAENFKPQLDEAINFYREDFREFATNAVKVCVETATPFDFEAVIVTANKNELWVRVIGKAELLNGECIRIYGSFQDIHERKQAEIRLQSLSNNIPGVVFQYVLYPDGTDRLLYVSDGAELIWGFSADEAMQNNQQIWKQVEKGGDLEAHKKSIEISIETKSLWKNKYKYVMPNNEIRTHLGYGSPTFLADGKIVFNSVILDITEEAKNEALLKETEQLLDSASKLARVGSWEIILKDNEEFKVVWSSITRDILEIDESFEPTIADCINFYKEPSRTLIAAALNNAIETGEVFDLELELVSGKGNDTWIRCIGDAQFENGKVTRVFGSFQDIDKRKVNELALRESLKTLEYYKFSLDQSAIVAYTDSKGVIRFVNDNFCKISQYSKEELIGKTHQIINSKHHPKEFFVDLWKTISSGKVWRGEIKNAAKDGSYYWVDTTIVPFLDENNKPFQYLAIRFEVTDRKIAEDIVLKTLEEKNNILESIGDSFFAVDKNWVLTYWNHIAESVLGKKKEDIVGKNLWAEYPDAINTEFYTKYHYAMETMETQSFEAYYDNRNQWVEVTAYPSEDGLSVYFKDITQRKKANEEIAKSEEKRRLIMNGALDAIISIDTNESITFWNPQAEVIFGWKAEEVMGKPLSETIISEAFRKYHVEGLKKYLKTGEGKALNVLLELSAMRRNREEFPIELTIIPIKQGGEEFFCAFIRDITERKRSELELQGINQKLSIQTKELQRSNEELEQFAFITSHDLQEPLRMITGFLSLLEKKYGNLVDDRGKQYIHFAVDGARRMRQIILDLLEYSRASKIEQKKEKVDVNEVVNEIKVLLRKEIKDKSAKINFEKLPVITTDSSPLLHVFQNLIGNALKYSKNGVAPEISITAIEEEKRWVFLVRDNGIGIKEEYYEKIFMIFQRLHTKEEYSGTGIGLAVTKKIVENMGGSIWVESIEGTGSTFYFTLQKQIL